MIEKVFVTMIKEKSYLKNIVSFFSILCKILDWLVEKFVQI